MAPLNFSALADDTPEFHPQRVAPPPAAAIPHLRTN